MMLNKKCIIYRKNSAKDSRNRPMESGETILGPFPCAISLPGRNRKNYEQGSPQGEIDVDFVMYGKASMDLIAGDVVEIDGTRYIASLPYKPRNHHTECNLSLQRSV